MNGTPTAGQVAHQQRAMALFDAWLDLDLPASQLPGWLLRECGDDDELRRQVEQLVLADAQDGEPVAGDVSGWRDAIGQAQADDDEDPLIGKTVGPWRIVGLQGRGGMGAVYRAERADGAYTQQAALKLIRIGLDTAVARARFLLERQILAGLHHPRIAGLLDGGLDAQGAPYFAMELVQGQRIDQWCDARQLDVRGRVRLFLQVLGAVAHAHRNLVVHRDLKPSNVLVDTQGNAKLLDFGIAKLVEDSGEDTRTGERALTPEYASPEQLHGEPITTATDVYQLGVLLYTLLAGAHPFGLDTHTPLRRQIAALDAEQIPLSKAAAGLSADVAARRGATPAALSKQLRGDLQAIVDHCLEKTPARRYAGATDLDADLRAWLQGRTVGARQPTTGYRFSRFLRRNRLAVGATAAVIVALATGLGIAMWQARQVAQQRDQVLAEMGRTESIKNYLMLMFRSPGEAQGDLTAKQVLDHSAKQLAAQYRDKPREHADLLQAVGSLYLYINDYDGVVPLLREYLDRHPADALPEQRADLGALLAEAELRRGDTVQARRRLDAAQAFWNADAVAYRKQLVGSRQLQAQVDKEESGLPRAIATLRKAVDEHDAYFGRNNIETANVLNSLGIVYVANGEIDLADAAYRDSWNVHQALGDANSAAALLTLGNWATVAYQKQDFARAESLLTRATQLRRDLYGPSAALAAMQANLGKIILRTGRPEDARVQLDPALAMSSQFTGGKSPLTISTMLSLVVAKAQLRDFTGAESTLTQAYAAARAHSGEGVFYALCMGSEARLRLAQGRLADARVLAGRMQETLDAAGDQAKAYQPELHRLRDDLQAAAKG